MIDRQSAKESVGPGWNTLIDEIYDRLPSTAIVVQVKEKFGGLRFYVDDADPDLWNFLRGMEEKSFEICEACGAPGKTRKETDGWMKTLCDEHATTGRSHWDPQDVDYKKATES